jgi:hypothetical protein
MLRKSVVLAAVLALAASALAGPRVDREMNENEKKDVERMAERIQNEITAYEEKHIPNMKQRSEGDAERYAEAGDYGEAMPKLAGDVVALNEQTVETMKEALKAYKEATDYKSYMAARLAWQDVEIARRKERVAGARYNGSRRVADYMLRKSRDRRLEENPEKAAQYDKAIELAKKALELEVAVYEQEAGLIEKRKELEKMWRLDLPAQDDLIQQD